MSYDEDWCLEWSQTSRVLSKFWGFMTTEILAWVKFQRESLICNHQNIEYIASIAFQTVWNLFRRDSNKDDVMEEACERISDIQSSLLSKVAEELVSEDMFQFLHAFTAGLQEYIEAVAFYVYVKHGCLVTKRELEEKYLRLRKSPTAKEGELKVWVLTLPFWRWWKMSFFPLNQLWNLLIQLFCVCLLKLTRISLHFSPYT